MLIHRHIDISTYKPNLPKPNLPTTTKKGETMQKIDISTDIDTMTPEQLAFELEEVRDAYERLSMIEEINSYLRKFETASELKTVLNLCKLQYETDHLKNWGFVAAPKDGITTIAENLASEYQAGLLNSFYAYMVDKLQQLPEGKGTQYLEGAFYTSHLAEYLKPLYDARTRTQEERTQDK